MLAYKDFATVLREKRYLALIPDWYDGDRPEANTSFFKGPVMPEGTVSMVRTKRTIDQFLTTPH